jgi:hypothetical protein
MENTTLSLLHLGIERRKDRMSKTLKAQITEITKSGRVTILFNQDINRISNISWINETSLNLELLDKSSDKKNFTWDIVSLTNAMMVLKVNFENPLYISNPSKDELSVKFICNGLFIETKTA